jgi:hypothetical protein
MNFFHTCFPGVYVFQPVSHLSGPLALAAQPGPVALHSILTDLFPVGKLLTGEKCTPNTRAIGMWIHRKLLEIHGPLKLQELFCPCVQRAVFVVPKETHDCNEVAGTVNTRASVDS